MSAVKEIEVQVVGARDLALISSDDSVWVVVPLRWWDLSSLLFWLFLPADRKAHIWLRLGDGSKVDFKAARVASKHVRVGGIYK